jgi:RNA polymerase sigma-70 factor (ECF subfamily)
MTAAGRETVTRLLRETSEDEAPPLDPLIAVLYDELHALSHRTLAAQFGEPSLSTTALLHEAYLKLVDGDGVAAKGRDYFFAAASRAMRQALVDHARRRSRVKRGGGAPHVRLEEAQIAVDGAFAEVLEVDQALTRLAEINPRAAQLVEGRFFGGLSLRESAGVLGVSERTAKRDWAFARAWLYRELTQGE